MGQFPDPESDRESSPEVDPNEDAASRRDRKFRIGLVLYGILAVAIWFTVGEGTIVVLGRQIEIRWIPMFVIGTFLFRTVMAREADKIRRGR